MEREPDFGEVTLDYDVTQPQLFVEVDRARASDLGVEIEGSGEALRGMLDGSTVGRVFVEDESYDVRMLSTAYPIDDPGDLENLFVRTESGEMAPLSSVVRLVERAVAPELGREEQQRAVRLRRRWRRGWRWARRWRGRRRWRRRSCRGGAHRAARRGGDAGGDERGACS
jgi:HAE1 family hydrophobic/amphiphilic exporter-1